MSGANSSTHLRPAPGSLNGGLPENRAPAWRPRQEEKEPDSNGPPPVALRRFGGGSPVLTPPSAPQPHQRQVTFADQQPPAQVQPGTQAPPQQRQGAFAPNATSRTQAKKQWGKGYWQRRRDAVEARSNSKGKGQKGFGKRK